MVLPEPFSPTSASDSPRWICRLIAGDGHAVGAGVTEPDVLELHAGFGIRTADRGAGAGLDRLLEVFVQRRQVQVVLVHAADGAEAGGHRGLALAEQHQVHGHLAQRDHAAHRLDGAPGVGAVQRGDAEQREGAAPGLAANGEIAVLLVEASKMPM